VSSAGRAWIVADGRRFPSNQALLAMSAWTSDAVALRRCSLRPRIETRQPRDPARRAARCEPARRRRTIRRRAPAPAKRQRRCWVRERAPRGARGGMATADRCIDRGSQRVASALSRMQERDGLQARAAGRSQLVRSRGAPDQCLGPRIWAKERAQRRDAVSPSGPRMPVGSAPCFQGRDVSAPVRGDSRRRMWSRPRRHASRSSVIGK
jgi:hypothetical protein